MVRYYIKEVPRFFQGVCRVRYEIWEDRGPFWNFVFGVLKYFTFGNLLYTQQYTYSDKNRFLNEWVKFKQLGG